MQPSCYHNALPCTPLTPTLTPAHTQSPQRHTLIPQVCGTTLQHPAHTLTPSPPPPALPCHAGSSSPSQELSWGKFKLCNLEEAGTWLHYLGSNCYSCMTSSNVCDSPPNITFHMYIHKLHPTRWKGQLLAMKAYLLTQNLWRTKLIVWAPEVAEIVTQQTEPFFEAFGEFVEVRRFVWETEVVGTAFHKHQTFGEQARLFKHFTAIAPYTDLVRVVLLHNYGGLWMDYDMVLFR